jgi:hypothetical protein
MAFLQDHMIVQKERALSDNITHNNTVIQQLDQVMAERNGLRQALAAYQRVVENARQLLTVRDGRMSQTRFEARRSLDRMRDELDMIRRLDEVSSSLAGLFSLITRSIVLKCDAIPWQFHFRAPKTPT